MIKTHFPRPPRDASGGPPLAARRIGRFPFILVRCNHHSIAKTSNQLKLKWVGILVAGQPEITQPQRHMGTIGWLCPAMGEVNELESKFQLPRTVPRGARAGQSQGQFRLKLENPLSSSEAAARDFEGP